MKIETIICDCCGEEIPNVKKKDILCERCAGNISLKMHKTRVELCGGLTE